MHCSLQEVRPTLNLEHQHYGMSNRRHGKNLKFDEIRHLGDESNKVTRDFQSALGWV